MRMIRPASIAALFITLSLAAHGQETPVADDDFGPLDQSVPVAEDSPAVSEPDVVETDNTLQTEEELLEEFARFRQYLDDKNYDEADMSAKRIVEMAIRLHGPQSIETSRALNNLAIVQANNRQFEAAIQNFTSAIEILEDLGNRLDEELVNPLRGLGAAQLESGRPDLASRSFNRATHITHVNEGPHNLEQVEILESLAEAEVRLGDLEAARDVLDRIHILNVRHFKGNSMALLPSLMRRADWQHRAGYFNDERATYRRAIRIIETASDNKEDPRLITPLVKLGESYYYYEPIADDLRASSPASGELHFKRAVRIAEGAEDLPWYDMATTKLALADYYLYYEGHSRARRVYQEVWDELSLDEDRLEMRKDLLEQAVPLRENPLPPYVGGYDNSGRDTGNILTGTIRVMYTVSTRGRVRNIRTEADPAEFTDMQQMVHREIRNRVFRPQFVDGSPVDSNELVFEHRFSYREEDLQKLREQNNQDLQSNQSSQ